MNTYKVYIKFKKGLGEDLSFSIDSEQSVKQGLIVEWEDIKKDGAWTVGDYTILTDEILWIRIEGDKYIEKFSGNKIQNKRKKV